MIIKYNSFINEAVQPDFLTKNPKFYLNNKHDDGNKATDEYYKKLGELYICLT